MGAATKKVLRSEDLFEMSDSSLLSILISALQKVQGISYSSLPQ